VTEASTSGKYDTAFYNQAGKRLRSMIAVAKFLNLVEDDKSAASALSKTSKAGSASSNKTPVKQGVGRPKNKRELESEQKKLKKEMDKLLKAHEKATKVLDDHRNDHKNDRYPVEDEVLIEEEEAEEAAQNGGSSSTVADLRHLANPDIDGFPGIPVECTPDLLMCWDFLCKFAFVFCFRCISYQIIHLMIIFFIESRFLGSPRYLLATSEPRTHLPRRFCSGSRHPPR
jgi:hypothetical protein